MAYFILFFLLPINLVCALLSWPIAFLKGRNPQRWFLANLVLGLIGLMLLVRLPRMRRCTRCGTTMRDDAPGCHHCGYGLMDGPNGSGVEEYRYCSACQSVIDKDALKCPICGASLD